MNLQQAEFLAVNQTVTITLQAPEGAPADYRSVEDTAGHGSGTSLWLSTEHAEEIVKAMEQGYEEARTTFGGALPDISSETLD